jgi:selenocysteine lyase/cysteine desulfurase
MYVRDAAHRNITPFMTGWFAQENIGAMDIYHHRPSPTARRFESGTPNVCGLYAVSAGLRFLLKLGLEAVSAQVRHLTAGIERRVDQRGWQLVTPAERGAMMAIRSTDAPQLVRRLGAEGIVVSDRDGNVRVSPHFYNNDGDLDRLFQVLDANADLLARQ